MCRHKALFSTRPTADDLVFGWSPRRRSSEHDDGEQCVKWGAHEDGGLLAIWCDGYTQMWRARRMAGRCIFVRDYVWCTISNWEIVVCIIQILDIIWVKGTRFIRSTQRQHSPAYARLHIWLRQYLNMIMQLLFRVCVFNINRKIETTTNRYRLVPIVYYAFRIVFFLGFRIVDFD